MTTTDDILKAQEKYSNPWAQKPDFTRLRELFVENMSEHCAVTNNTAFDSDGYIMEAFDKAVEAMKEE